MKIRLFLIALALGVLASASAATAADSLSRAKQRKNMVQPTDRGAQGEGEQCGSAQITYQGQFMPGQWHTGYYHPSWGQPMPVVVPPTVTHQTNWGWGIGNTRVSRIDPRFRGPDHRAAGEYGMTGERWYPRPRWPYDTLQFGAYYIRGPW